MGVLSALLKFLRIKKDKTRVKSDKDEPEEEYKSDAVPIPSKNKDFGSQKPLADKKSLKSTVKRGSDDERRSDATGKVKKDKKKNKAQAFISEMENNSPKTIVNIQNLQGTASVGNSQLHENSKNELSIHIENTDNKIYVVSDSSSKFVMNQIISNKDDLKSEMEKVKKFAIKKPRTRDRSRSNSRERPTHMRSKDSSISRSRSPSPSRTVTSRDAAQVPGQ